MQETSSIIDVTRFDTLRTKVLERLSTAAAFIKRDFKIAISYRLQFIFQFLQTFFSIAVIYFIGQLLKDGGKGWMLKAYGSDYFSFALIGLAINSYLRTGLVTLTTDIRQAMNQGTLEAMCAAPIGYTWLIMCSALWQFIFETVRVVCCFVMAVCIFGMRLPHANWPCAVLTLVLTIPTFLMLGTMSCSILVVAKKGDPVNWIFSSVGALLAGTMFPVSVLPTWLQYISRYVPLTHSLEALRKSLLTGAGIGQVAGSLLALFGFIVVLIPVTIFVCTMCMRWAKKNGAFSTH
jgi:ABC-2 type transport system permease protein